MRPVACVDWTVLQGKRMTRIEVLRDEASNHLQVMAVLEWEEDLAGKSITLRSSMHLYTFREEL